MIQDYKQIEELTVKKNKRVERLQEISERCLKHFKEILPKALEKYEEVFLLTHVPPFKESCSFPIFEFKEEWLFHFYCHSMGEYLTDIMNRKEHKNKRLFVMAGHVHQGNFYMPQKNITVIVTNASYSKPQIYSEIII